LSAPASVAELRLNLTQNTFPETKDLDESFLNNNHRRRTIAFPLVVCSSPAMDFNSSSPFPEGVISFLDTDLYKLTMQCAVFKFFKDVPVTYAFTNRTPDKKLSRAAFKWLEEQIRSMYFFLFS